MKPNDPRVPDHEVDWSLTTWEGVRKEQMRRWAQLPLERAIMALEEMEEIARAFQGGGDRAIERHRELVRNPVSRMGLKGFDHGT